MSLYLRKSLLLLHLIPCVFAVFSARHARAESAVLLPHSGDASLLDQRERAQNAIAAALRDAGFTLRVQPAAAGAAAERTCAQVSCAPALIKQLGTDVAVALAVWQSASAREVHVTIVDSEGGHFPGRAVLEADSDLAQAARTALVDAQSLRLLGPGPWVAVNGEPEGAAVWIDGRFAGSLPYRASLAPGDHTLEVRADGRAAKQLELRVPLEPTATARVDVALEPSDGSPEATAAAAAPAAPPASPITAAASQPRDRSSRGESSIWNFIAGGTLIGVGGALIIVDPLRAAARDGRCADPECNRVYHFGTRSALELAAGIALAGAGITMLIWQPLRVNAEVGPDRAMLRGRLAF